MRKIPIFIILTLFLSCLLFASLSMGATVHTIPNPEDTATNIHTEIGAYTLTVESTGGQTHCVNISLYTGTTNVTDVYHTAQTNGSKSLTLPSLDGNTLYRVEIESNDTSGFTYANYTFTTGAKRLTDDTDNFSSGEILVVALITIVMIIAFVVSVVNDMKEHKKLDSKTLINRLIVVIFFAVVMTIIAGLV